MSHIYRAVPIEKPETLRVCGVVDVMPLGAMLDQLVWDPGEYRMARGWRYTKLSLSSALLRVARVFPFVLLFAYIDVSMHRCFFLWVPLLVSVSYMYYTILSSLAFVFLSFLPCFLKKNQNAPRPSEHPPIRGEKMSKRLGGIKGCKFLCFGFMLSLELCRCSSDLFLSSRPRTGWATVLYYWVWLRPDRLKRTVHIHTHIQFRLLLLLCSSH